MPFDLTSPQNSPGRPTMETIVQARDKCAWVITKYGEKYLPIFERLESEIKKRNEQNRLLSKALRIGTQNGTQSGTHLKRQFLKSSK